MRKVKLLRLTSLLALLGSAGCAYHNPVAPSATPIDLSAPFQVTLGASPGSGAQAGSATLTARVQNANGAALANVVVTFTTSRGSIAPDRVATGVDGTAAATLIATDTADVTAAAGTLSAHTLVVAQAPTPVPPTPTPTPVPTPTPTPSPALPVAFLNVSGSATTGVPLTFGVSSSATGVTWLWSFGDGTTTQTTAFSATHTYNTAGTFTASVSSGATSAASATIKVTDPVVIPTPTAQLAASLTCTPGIHNPIITIPPTTPTFCNVSLTYGGALLPANAVTNVDWDWGDGTTATADNVSTLPVKSHQYANASTYIVVATVTASTVDGPRMAVASKSVVIP